MATVIKIEGLPQLANALRLLPLNVAQKRLGKPVSDAAAMIRDMARALAPIANPEQLSVQQPPPGTLRKAIVVSRDKSAPPSARRYIVSVLHGKKRMRVGKEGENKDAYYWTFIEFGTVKYAAHPFLRPAFEALKSTAVSNIVADIRSGIEAEALALKWTIGGAR